MSRIRAEDTVPELIIRRGLWAEGFRYRLHVKTPGGKADLVLPSQKFALFVDGCFWHGCPEHYVRPRTSNPFWDRKLRENVERDRRQTQKLVDEGWRFLRVWEHEVHEDAARVLAAIRDALNGEPARPPQPAWRVVNVKWLDEAASLERRLCEDLLEPTLRRTEERKRSTKKVGRVRARVVNMSPEPDMGPGLRDPL
jgi:DNA mismatch endonuclease (patch repair protein)